MKAISKTTQETAKLDGVPLNEPAVLGWLRNYVDDGIWFWNQYAILRGKLR